MEISLLCPRASGFMENPYPHFVWGEKDDLTSMETIKAFAEKNNAELTVMPGGEHWFHTKEQMQFLDNWIKNRRPCNETENKDGFACL